MPERVSIREHAQRCCLRSTDVDAPFQEFSVERVDYFTSLSLAQCDGGRGLLAGRRANYPSLHSVATVEARRWRPSIDGSSPRFSPVQPDASGAARASATTFGCRWSWRREVIDRIADLASSGQRLYVWGTGTHTLHLLETSRLGGLPYRGLPGLEPTLRRCDARGATPSSRPSELPAADAPILVSSAVSQSGIATAARERFRPGRPPHPALLSHG